MRMKLLMRLRGRENTFRFLMPLAHVICDSNKARAMIGYVSAENYQPGVIPSADNWFKAADFDNEDCTRRLRPIFLTVLILPAFLFVLRVVIPLRLKFNTVRLCLTCFL